MQGKFGGSLGLLPDGCRGGGECDTSPQQSNLATVSTQTDIGQKSIRVESCSSHRWPFKGGNRYLRKKQRSLGLFQRLIKIDVTMRDIKK
jgi:hypothetical protein